MHSPDVVDRLARGLPGYSRLATFGAALPYYECTLEIRLLRKQELSAVEQICLECVANRFDSAPEIEAILGLSPEMVVDALGNLVDADLVDPSWDGESETRFQLTDRGSTALVEQCYLEPETTRFRVMYDALKGELAPTGVLQHINDGEVERAGLHSLPARMSPPDVGDLVIQDLADVLRQTQKSEPGRVPEGELYDVVSVERTSRVSLPCVIVAFGAEDQSAVALRVLERETRRPDYEEILEAMLVRDREVLPLQPRVEEVPIAVPVDAWLSEADRRATDVEGASRELEDVRAEVARVTQAHTLESTPNTREQLTALQARVAALEAELADKQRQIHSVRRVDTTEHRPLLEKALKDARRVIIMSPWLNRLAVDTQLIEEMRRALRRGARIVIGWGYPETAESERERRSERTLSHLRNLASEQGLKGKLDIVKHGNTHKKVLIADDRFMVVSSFNWLSYRGDPELGIRDEFGVYMELPDIIRETASDFMRRLSLTDDPPPQPQPRPKQEKSKQGRSERKRSPAPRVEEDPATKFERAGWRVSKPDKSERKRRN